MKSRRNFPNRINARRQKSLENLRKHLANYSAGKHYHGETEFKDKDEAKRQVERIKYEIGVLEERIKLSY